MSRDYTCFFRIVSEELNATHQLLLMWQEAISLSNRNRRKLSSIIVNNLFELNPEKSRVQNYTGRREVNGLTVNEKVNVKKDFIKKIRLMLYLWENNRLDQALGRFCADIEENKRLFVFKSKINSI